MLQHEATLAGNDIVPQDELRYSPCLSRRRRLEGSGNPRSCRVELANKQSEKATRQHLQRCLGTGISSFYPMPPACAGWQVCPSQSVLCSQAFWSYLGGGGTNSDSHSFILALIVLPCSPLSGILDNAVVKEGRMGGVERVFHRHLLPACMLLNSYSLAYSCCTVC